MRRSRMSAVCVVGIPGHWLFCSTGAPLGAVAWIGRCPLNFVDVTLIERHMNHSDSLIILYFQADCVPYIQLCSFVLVCSILSSSSGKRHRILFMLA